VTDQHDGSAEVFNEGHHVTDEQLHAVVADRGRLRTSPTAPQVGNSRSKTGCAHLGRHVTPENSGVGPAVKKENGGSFAFDVHCQRDVTVSDEMSFHSKTVDHGHALI
jgi:hypothetical protein